MPNRPLLKDDIFLANRDKKGQMSWPFKLYVNGPYFRTGPFNHSSGPTRDKEIASTYLKVFLRCTKYLRKIVSLSWDGSRNTGYFTIHIDLILLGLSTWNFTGPNIGWSSLYVWPAPCMLKSLQIVCSASTLFALLVQWHVNRIIYSPVPPPFYIDMNHSRRK